MRLLRGVGRDRSEVVSETGVLQQTQKGGHGKADNRIVVPVDRVDQRRAEPLDSVPARFVHGFARGDVGCGGGTVVRGGSPAQRHRDRPHGPGGLSVAVQPARYPEPGAKGEPADTDH